MSRSSSRASRALPGGFELLYTLEGVDEGAITGFVWHPRGESYACLIESQDADYSLWFGTHPVGDLGFGVTGLAEHFFSIAASSDEETIAIGGRDSRILLYDFHTGGELEVLSDGRPEIVQDLSWAPDGRRLAALADRVQIWEANSGKLLQTFKYRRDKFATTLSWSPDGAHVAWAADGVHIGNVATGKVVSKLEHDELAGATAVAWSPTGRHLVLGGFPTRRLVSWDLEAETPAVVQDDDWEWPALGRFSPDGRLLASCSPECLRIWSTGDGEELASFSKGPSFANDFAFHPTEPIFATSALDREGNLALDVIALDDSSVPEAPTPYQLTPLTAAGPPKAKPKASSGYDVFLSYSTSERPVAQRLAQALQDRGWSVWWDVEQLRGGDRWRSTIAEALSSSSCVVVLWSESSTQSLFVQEEAEVGSKRGIILPVRIDDCEIPFGFGGIHTLDLRAWRRGRGKRQLAQLLEHLDERLGSR